MTEQPGRSSHRRRPNSPLLRDGTAYDFAVKAVNAVGASAASNEASAIPTTVPSAPLALTATAARVEPIPPSGSRLAATPDGTGWWVLSVNGSVSAYGDATNYGSPLAQGVHLNSAPVGIAATPDGLG